MASRREQRVTLADRPDRQEHLGHQDHLVRRLERHCLECCRRLELELLAELGTRSQPLGER